MDTYRTKILVQVSIRVHKQLKVSQIIHNNIIIIIIDKINGDATSDGTRNS